VTIKALMSAILGYERAAMRPELCRTWQYMYLAHKLTLHSSNPSYRAWRLLDNDALSAAAFGACVVNHWP
jgi:hypothetical protein